MKIHDHNQEQQKSKQELQVQQETSNGGDTTFLDQRPSTMLQRKLMTGMNDQAGNPVIPIQRKENKSGLPDRLKTGIENLSGYAMDDVKVHYNSNKPSQLQAHAYAQGTDIHLAPGQEKHLPHEAWHVVQQKQGRVKPTIQLKSNVDVNDDPLLEKEADEMGEKAQHISNESVPSEMRQISISGEIVQRLTGYEVETNIPIFSDYNKGQLELTEEGEQGYNETITPFLAGGLIYGMNYGEDIKGRFQISADHNVLSRIHRRIIDKLVVLGLLKADTKRRAMSNLEYITPPRQEVEVGSIQTHQEDITAVKEHIDVTLPLAQDTSINEVPVTANHIYTGQPRQELISWLEDNDINPLVILPDLDDFQNAIDNSVYVQETSGVLPADIPLVYERASNAIDENNGDADKAKILSQLMKNANNHAERAFSNLKDPPYRFTKHRSAVVGYLALISTYLQADEVSKLKDFLSQNSVPKNLLPFLSKTPLRSTKEALPTVVRPGWRNAKTWKRLTQHLIFLTQTEASAEQLSKKFGLAVNPDVTTGRIFPDVANDTDASGPELAMKKLSRGKTNEDEHIENVRVAKTLDTDSPAYVITEALEDSGAETNMFEKARNRIFSGKDRSAAQKGIPIEDRYFQSQLAEPITAENMEEMIRERFKFAVKLQLDHLDEDDVESEKDNVEKELDDDERYDARILLLTNKLEKINDLTSSLVLPNQNDEIQKNIVLGDRLLELPVEYENTVKIDELEKLHEDMHERYQELLHHMNDSVNKEEHRDDKNFTFTHSRDRSVVPWFKNTAQRYIKIKKSITKLSKESDRKEMKKLYIAISGNDKSWVNFAKSEEKRKVLKEDMDPKLIMNIFAEKIPLLEEAEALYKRSPKKKPLR